MININERIYMKWSDNYGNEGVIGMYVDDGLQFHMNNLDGQALPAELLYPAIRKFFSKEFNNEWMNELEEMHKSRKRPWRVEKAESPYGAINYLMYTCPNPQYNFGTVSAHIHVSMNGKINRGIRLWVGDILPLLSIFVKDWYMCLWTIKYDLGFLEPVEPKYFFEPGDSSGFEEELKDEETLK